MLHRHPGWPKNARRVPRLARAPAGGPGAHPRRAEADGARLERHTLIKSNVHIALAQALRGLGCRALVDGAIVEVDGLVTCSELDFATPRLGDPVIIVEVLSPSNQGDPARRPRADQEVSWLRINTST
jgi:hypothetical protein